MHRLPLVPFLCLLLCRCGSSTADNPIAATVEITELSEQCAGNPAPDPLQVRGSFRLDNQGQSTAGPVTVSGGEVLDESGTTALGTFAIQELVLRPVPAGGSVGANFEKSAGSFMAAPPLSACQAVRCFKPVHIALSYTGPVADTGMPRVARAVSKVERVSCR